jgi:hypothetical protein
MNITMFDRLITAIAANKIYVILIVVICLIFSGIVVIESDAMGMGKGGVSVLDMLFGSRGSNENINNNLNPGIESSSPIDYIRYWAASVTEGKVPAEQPSEVPAQESSSSPPPVDSFQSPPSSQYVKEDTKTISTPPPESPIPTQRPATVETTSPMVPELDTFITVSLLSVLLIVFVVYSRRNNGG